MNEASPHILEGLKNHVTPDVGSLCQALRAESLKDGDTLRHEAPFIVSRAAEWILEYSEEICEVIEAGTRGLPMSRPMLIEAFNNCVSRWIDPERLRGLVREECSSLNVGRPLLPRLIFHNLAGNLFVSGWESITHATLLGAASIVRCSEHDRVFPSVWARALEMAAREVSGLIAVCEWPSEDVGRFKRAINEADATVAFGSDESVYELRRLGAWNKPFSAHGSAVSFAMITAEELRNSPVEWLAEGSAYDFAAYDQQGCLSPRALFLEDRHPRDVDRLVDALYAAATLLERNLPRNVLTLEERAAMARMRDEVLLDAACGGTSRRVSTDKDPFLITVKPISNFSLGPVNRYINIYLYKDLSEIEAALGSLRGRISTLGVPDPRRAPSEFLSNLEIKRVCPLGSMQIPPLSWCLDGYRPLQKFFRMQSIQIG